MFARRVMSRLSSAARTAHAARAAHVARVSIAGHGSVSRYGAALSQSVAAAWQPASSCTAAFSAPPSARSFAVFTSGFPDVPIPDVPLTEVPPGYTTCSSADCNDLTRPFELLQYILDGVEKFGDKDAFINGATGDAIKYSELSNRTSARLVWLTQG